MTMSESDDEGTSAVDDGGTAFPITATVDSCQRSWGMSLRDWFAGQALAGWLASFPPEALPKATACASLAYDMADAMIAARGGRS
jgi:hypothetical protein